MQEKHRKPITQLSKTQVRNTEIILLISGIAMIIVLVVAFYLAYYA